MLIESPAPIISQQLRSGEQVLWYGKPSAMRMARSQFSPVLMGVFWTVFVTFMFNTAQKNFGSGSSFSASGSSFSNFQNIFSLFLVVFMGVGVWMILTPVRNYIKALRTYYAVTNEQAIIVSGVFSTRIISYTKRDIRSIRGVGYGDGTGDVVFGWDQYTVTDYDNRSAVNVNFNAARSNTNISFGSRQRTVTVGIGFYGIPDHQDVEALMQNMFGEDEAKV